MHITKCKWSAWIPTMYLTQLFTVQVYSQEKLVEKFPRQWKIKQRSEETLHSHTEQQPKWEGYFTADWNQDTAWCYAINTSNVQILILKYLHQSDFMSRKYVHNQKQMKWSAWILIKYPKRGKERRF